MPFFISKVGTLDIICIILTIVRIITATTTITVLTMRIIIVDNDKHTYSRPGVDRIWSFQQGHQ